MLRFCWSYHGAEQTVCSHVEVAPPACLRVVSAESRKDRDHYHSAVVTSKFGTGTVGGNEAQQSMDHVFGDRVYTIAKAQTVELSWCSGRTNQGTPALLDRPTRSIPITRQSHR